MQGDKLTEVVPTHDNRVMLLTDRHLGLLSVKSTGSRSTYKALWVVSLREVQTVRGGWHSHALLLCHTKLSA